MLQKLTQHVEAPAACLPPRPGAQEAGPAAVGHELTAGAGRHQVAQLVLAEVGAVTLGEGGRHVREHVQALGVGVQAAAGHGGRGGRAPGEKRGAKFESKGVNCLNPLHSPQRRRQEQQRRQVRRRSPRAHDFCEAAAATSHSSRRKYPFSTQQTSVWSTKHI